MKDIFGTALLDYYRGNYSEDITTETSISDEDVLPLPYLFRSFDEMPLLEQRALQEARGSVLDIGCGAGSHALYLQQKGIEVTAIDVSPGAVEVAQLRGVNQVLHGDALQLKNKKFDTLLALMNGAGILETLDKASKNLQRLMRLLKPDGQLLVDSSDLRYMYDQGEDGGIWVPADRYYGELDYTISYKGMQEQPFPWLYLDPIRFQGLCEDNQLRFELIEEGDHFDYLARITAPERNRA
ncbi:MAG: class I SAM-dependent methyltransferase [Bacteroidota bacterium]